MSSTVPDAGDISPVHIIRSNPFTKSSHSDITASSRGLLFRLIRYLVSRNQQGIRFTLWGTGNRVRGEKKIFKGGSGSFLA